MSYVDLDYTKNLIIRGVYSEKAAPSYEVLNSKTEEILLVSSDLYEARDFFWSKVNEIASAH